ncbi:sulfite oxidase [Halococcus thailandensis]|jgi:DMSO/TMAO reductase YedYZ molybdopterin-dependent catalytic subunit|uniref:sulfite oxidase n=1 Tax=Halococcus thailandensis TaxID=335952 RepID=UPI0009B5CD8F|nr:sulfite oxidase [Halococcus thailandensis]
MRREWLSRDPENAQVAQRAEFTRDPTPAATHFTRNHYPTPSIDAEEWTLSVTGLVDRSADVPLADLQRTFRTETVTTTIGCAGNGRSGFRPRAAGHQWGVGALSTARWTGVPVGEVLHSAGACLDDDCWVAAIGDDAPEGESVFARSLPMRKLLEDCLLAYGMNGHPLPAEHGAPVRLIVPGWYGTNSVKWLSRLHVMETMLCGPEWEEYTHWQQEKYRLVPQGEQPTERETIDAFDLGDQFADPSIRHPFMYGMLVNSLIVSPGPDESLAPERGDSVTIQGVAWAGDNDISAVEVSTDGGETWHSATLLGDDEQPCWRQFGFEWTPRSGTHTLVSRATDDRGRTQPAAISDPDERLLTIANRKFPWNKRGYASNAYGPVATTVTAE